MDASTAKSHETPVAVKDDRRPPLTRAILRALGETLAALVILVGITAGCVLAWGPSLIGADILAIHELGMKSLGLRVALGCGTEEDILTAVKASGQSESKNWKVDDTMTRLAGMYLLLPWGERIGVELRAVDALVMNEEDERTRIRSMSFIMLVKLRDRSLRSLVMSRDLSLQEYGFMQLKHDTAGLPHEWNQELNSLWSGATREQRRNAQCLILTDVVRDRNMVFLCSHKDEISELVASDYRWLSKSATRAMRIIEQTE